MPLLSPKITQNLQFLSLYLKKSHFCFTENDFRLRKGGEGSGVRGHTTENQPNANEFPPNVLEQYKEHFSNKAKALAEENKKYESVVPRAHFDASYDKFDAKDYFGNKELADKLGTDKNPFVTPEHNAYQKEKFYNNMATSRIPEMMAGKMPPQREKMSWDLYNRIKGDAKKMVKGGEGSGVKGHTTEQAQNPANDLEAKKTEAKAKIEGLISEFAKDKDILEAVKSIESGAKTTQNHYGRYMSALSPYTKDRVALHIVGFHVRAPSDPAGNARKGP
jgi:hypothetical protein